MNEGSSNSLVSPEVFGLVAGWGHYPLEVARRLKSAGKRVCCVALAGHVSDDLKQWCDSYQVFGLGRMGAQTNFFRRHGVRRATMAGKVFKTKLLERFSFIRHRPDWLFLKYFYKQFVTGTENRNDDTMLLTVTRLYKDRGIEFVPATDFVPELLIQEGVHTRRIPTAAQRQDIRFGWELAKAMGGLDIGQSVAVKGRAILAVEAIEGTDECIRRAGTLCPAGGFTVVKVAKPQQDLRFDMPTIGEGTIRTMAEAKASVLAVEANMTIFLEQERVLKLADSLGIAIIAVKDQSQTLPINETTAQSA
jgi:UDP-2,3-diacylglucosamine hydrolase